MIRRLDAGALGVDGVVRALDRAAASVDAETRERVAQIVAAVREKGDAALLELTARFDRVALAPCDLAVSPAEYEAAERQVGARTVEALRYAAARIERFHRATMPRSWSTTDDNGSVLGQEVRPLERVGIYVPGGRAAYPSTVLMTAVPARVAGVKEIVLLSPPGPDRSLPSAVLAAARIAGVTEAYRVGGAQAIAALAYGTETIRRVDKIVGPGNIYVALAKALVFGDVGIDMLAGPSEVVVIADGDADPACVAADLLAQAEHDPMARAVLLTSSPGLRDRVQAETERQLAGLHRREIASSALRAHGALVLTASLEEAVEVANRLAPEHLELAVADPEALLARVRHAGAVFLGGFTPEVVGDYVAGPSHVLPTGGTARFSSALGTEDFVKRLSVIRYSPRGLAEAWPHLAELARVEGLDAHGAAAGVRITNTGGGA
ncbi:MAG: histidinol dehydrogenase [Candidatus Rokubacteria bacterium GWC2_70_16]|nr:MAG: histidinol dehydrogenase [Candidatus Rokubacteria bacterium GWC2_70_16]OGL14858.1 MAG: histidinol dehydrogenase [Candidatus Rokubacteria bacterium RIFCSPLOWO2_12_FULL_71_19]